MDNLWNRSKWGLLIVTVFAAGWFARVWFHADDHANEIEQVRENSSEYKFINPLIFVADRRKVEFEEYVDLKNKLEDVVSEAMSQGEVKNTSIYFRDLNGGEWFSINPEELYAPSSMLKVGTLMAYLKLATDDPNILKEKIAYTPTGTEGQTYKVESPLPAGLYTADALLRQMIVESDNDAMTALNAVHVEQVLKIYKDLQLPDPLSDDLDFMSVGAYSRIFRTLYNGTYISREYSEKALELLSHTKFNGGITASTGNTVVSHKFGELTHILDNKKTERELHDCGIVYYARAPYVLCIMTRGDQFPDLQSVISRVSKTVFDYMKDLNGI